MAVNFADGWQGEGKAAHQSIRDTGNDVRNAVHRSEQAQADASAAKNAASVEQPAANQPVAPGKDVPQTQQKARPETQDQASMTKHAEKAAKEHLEAKQHAKDLANLSTKLSTTTRSESAATRKPVTAKQQVLQPQVKTQDAGQQKQAGKADQASQPQFQAQAQTKVAKQTADTLPKAPKAKAAKGSKAKGGEAANAKGNAKVVSEDAQAAAKSVGLQAEGAAQAASQAQGAAVTTKDTGVDDVEKSKEEELEEKDQNTSTFANGSRVRSTKKELGGLLGGFSGDTAGDEADGTAGAVAQADAVEANKLPETDPEFHVYSEFDEANPGVEMVKAKAQVFERLVEKRIKEIAKLDHEIGGRIRDIFETTPLSKRIVGELAGELETANFLKSVYGGIVG